jgi:queuine tRNA-ribosyltransferase
MSDSIFNLLSTDNNARRGEVVTSHGKFQTPAFIPVGTTGAVKALISSDLEECGADIILGNTYHLYLRPGVDVIKEMGGLAKFNSWNKPTLTDSGGYQVFSLQDISKISDEGVKFQSHYDGSYHMFTPEKVIDIQHGLGADIIMAFDQCVPYPADRQMAQEGVDRTYQWAKQCMSRHRELLTKDKKGIHLFGIAQGSVYKDLRIESSEQIVSLDFPGYAIGGLSVGESKDEMEEMLSYSIEILPKDKPRYLMGVGYPEDLFMAVSYGIDMFDCVLPTRNARTGYVFTSEGPLIYRNAEYIKDDRPLDPNCDCKVCKRYSRSYIRHMYNQSEITGMVLASYHSTYFFQNLMKNMRKSIEENRFDRFRTSFLNSYDTKSR